MLISIVTTRLLRHLGEANDHGAVIQNAGFYRLVLEWTWGKVVFCF